ncbi:hypothetical protein CYQ88_08330 [Hydrogenovibrio sp. SC-1]|uniref:DUF2895 family protein n=1 Tax=Hydrogenovibrio sp. SC-1 TaxID=2065820 RepID=UPI000C7BBCE6|nr:DUF2895 family protein [Hydrogenovibrio sp. SC-1]PLA73961.1 hypothetical protein CYQ88_08330 [Hydrogenovibrio sp. SC-1]
MSDPYKDKRANDISHINTLRFVIGSLILTLIISLGINFIQAQEPEAQRLSLPPELKYGASLSTGKINSWEIYNFTGAIYQQLNTWLTNGETDYIDNIKKYSALFTHRFIAQKHKEFTKKKNRLELKDRQRSLSPLGDYSETDHCGNYHDTCVKNLGAGRWKVWLDINLREWQQASKDTLPYELKNLKLRVPFLVIYDDTNTEYNPWGLKIDYEFTNEIQKISLEGSQK